MKYILVLGDGMADEPIASLGGKTPLEVANTPVMDEMASAGEMGMVSTIPEGMSPGSDTANLSVLGYDPKIYYTGRSPLEALSIGAPMKDTDVVYRCNIVTLSEDEDVFEEKKIIDHSSSEIETEDAKVLLEAVVKELHYEGYDFYAGTSYRHCLIWDHGQVLPMIQPHDVLGHVIGQYLPKNEVFLQMMKKSYEILSQHPLNQERKAKGLNPANCFWFWGAGTKPILSSFEEKYGKKGAMISAVDLLKGIAVGADMHNVIVEGANGGLHTNYEGKAQAAVDSVLKQGYDFAYVHVEAPDEMGHQGSIENKILAIEYLDQRVIKVIKDQMDASGEDYCMMVLPDHPTPIRVRTHTSAPVPYLIYNSTKQEKKVCRYSEKEAALTGRGFTEGQQLLKYLFLL